MCSMRWRIPRRGAGTLVRVEGAANGRIPDGVGRALESRLSEDADGLLVFARIGPERIGAHPLRVRLDEPGGATFDHAVDEELGHPASPAFSAGRRGRTSCSRIESKVNRVVARAERSCGWSGRRGPPSSAAGRYVSGEPSMAWMPVKPTAFHCFMLPGTSRIWSPRSVPASRG